MKLMFNPKHGYHHAYSPQEEAVMRGNGWVDHVPAEPVAPAAEVVEAPAEAPEVVRRPVGRPRKN